MLAGAEGQDGARHATERHTFLWRLDGHDLLASPWKQQNLLPPAVALKDQAQESRKCY
jgi:hypothetical protein